MKLGENVAASMDYDPQRVWECLEKAGMRERTEKMDEVLETDLSFSIKLRLCLPELSIKPFLLVKQFLVSAPLGNGPTVKDEHQVTET
mgnify:CR=1 FL=1